MSEYALKSKVDLEAEADDRRPGLERVQRRRVVQVAVDPRREAVGNERLLGEAQREEEQSGADAVGVERMPAQQLRLQDPVPDDRSRDQVRGRRR
jgi:hypothetical protein